MSHDNGEQRLETTGLQNRCILSIGEMSDVAEGARLEIGFAPAARIRLKA